MCESPVLLIFFNRPDTLQETFAAIRKAKPKKLYLAQDGVRSGNHSDQENINKCREIVENIDWDCEVFRRYSDINQGCGRGPYNAINWVFEAEETAIILEDDCVASDSFFRFCDEMLRKYYFDERMFLITGCNFELVSNDTECSYFFGYSGTNCGWATWKRNWGKMDYECSWMTDRYTRNNLKRVLTKLQGDKGSKEFCHFENTYHRLKNGENLSYWDVQWQALRYLNHQLSIIPEKNLITNIGLGPTSTHAQHTNVPDKYYDKEGEIHFCYNKRYEMEFPLKHPKYVIQNTRYDELIDRKINPSVIKKVLRKLKIGGE